MLPLLFKHFLSWFVPAQKRVAEQLPRSQDKNAYALDLLYDR